MKRFSATVLALLALTVQSHADEAAIVTYEVDASFEDATLNVQDAIINRGLVVDYVARVGDMLNRTADDVGAEQKVYASADVHIFCSATLSRKMMEADVTNVGHCPYGIFVYALADHPGTTHIGYRRMPAGVMSEVENLLDEIAREAAEID
jgi:hypothetical protein